VADLSNALLPLMIDNKQLRTFGPEREESEKKQHNEEIHNLSSYNDLVVQSNNGSSVK
jgi:hypothetical protein